MNWRRGFFRIWLLSSGVWLIVFWYWLWATRLHDLRDDKTGQMLDVVAFQMRPWERAWTEPKDFTVLDIVSLAVVSFGVPLLALVIARCLKWTADGFRK